MIRAIAEGPRVLHAIPGRMRVHLPGWSGRGRRRIEARLGQVHGVRSVAANPLTGNLVVRFDPAATDERTILDRVLEIKADSAGAAEADEPEPPPTLQEGWGRIRRARIAVRGIDHDPRLARQVVERLERRPGVTARANPLTGRVLVEFDKHQVELEDLLSEVAGLELPDLPGEDRPSHPLDRAPLVQSAIRTAGAALGLGLLAARRLGALDGIPTGARGAATAGGVIGLLQGFPLIRNGLRLLLGENLADLLLSGSGIIAQTVSASPLGLAVAGAEAVRVLTLVIARRAAWRGYEHRLGTAPSLHPGAVIHLAAPERVPLAAKVLEGTGTAIGRDGLPVPVVPGAVLPAGARLAGRPVVVELQSPRPFIPQPRPQSDVASIYGPAIRGTTLLALAHAGVTAVATGSPARVFQALLLVNPRTVVIGAEAANLSAAARVLRAGVTIVGTRRDRPVRLPHVLLLDGPRLLTDGLELAGVRPLIDDRDPSEILTLAASVAAAAGAPWGAAWPNGGHGAADGGFDGATATASLGGARYTLGPIGDRDFDGREPLPAAARDLDPGDYPLLLRGGPEQRPLGVLALRPRLAPGVTDLVQGARRHGVDVALLADGDRAAAQAVARRAGLPLLVHDRAVDVVRQRQQGGAVVMLVSDSADAAEAFSACDLAIGLAPGPHAWFPARVDLLAPGLAAVAAVLDAGARREAAVRDSLILALAANVAGAVWGLVGEPGVDPASLGNDLTSLGALLGGWARLSGGEAS